MQQKKPYFAFLGCYVFFVLFIYFSIFNTKTGTLEICADQQIEKIQYDTGYGFNKFQTLVNENNLTQPDFSLNNPQPCYQIVKLDIKLEVSRIKIFSDKSNLQLFQKTQGEFQNISQFLTYQPESGVYLLNQLHAYPRNRNLAETFYFLLGSSLLLLLAYFIFLFIRDCVYKCEKNKIYFRTISLVLLLVQLISWYFYYPGPINIFNPVHSIHTYSFFGFSPVDSVFVQLIWGALFEVVPNIFFIIIFQNLFFLTLVLYLVYLALQSNFNKLLLSLAAFFMFLHPQAYLLNFFLERSVASAYCNVIAIFSSLLILLNRSPQKPVYLIFVFACVFSALSRSENIIFVAPLIFYVTYKSFNLKKSTLALVGFLAFYFLQIMLINSLPFIRVSSPAYTTLNLIPTLADLIRLNASNPNFLSEEELKTVGAVVKYENIAKGEPFTPVDIHKNLKYTSDEQHKKFQLLFLKMALSNFDDFWLSRFKIFNQTINSPYIGHYLSDAEKFITNSWVFDIGYIPSHLARQQNGEFTGFYLDFDIYYFSIKYKYISFLHWQLLILFICVVLYKKAPLTAVVAFIFSFRIFAVFMLAPSSFYLYYADLYFLGGVFLAALGYELKNNQPQYKNPNQPS